MKQFSIFLLCCFGLLFGTYSLDAQKGKSFSLEVSMGSGFSDFLLAPNPLDVLWSTPGDNTDYTITTRTKIGLAWQVGLGVVKPIDDRVQLRARLSFYRGRFSHLMEDLVFASDLLNSPNGLSKTSNLRSDIRFTNIDIPFMADFDWSAKAAPFFGTVGMGLSTTLKTAGETVITYSDGRIENDIAQTSYEAAKWKGFMLLGIGKRIPLGTSGKQITIGSQLKYYLAKEALQIFDSAGRLIHTNLLLTFQL